MVGLRRCPGKYSRGQRGSPKPTPRRRVFNNEGPNRRRTRSYREGQDMPDGFQVVNGVPYCRTEHVPFWHVSALREIITAVPNVARACDSAQWDEDQWMAESARDAELTAQTGYERCPMCGERKLKVTTRFTRNYGGGWDSHYRCHNCGYKDVAV